MTPAIEGWVDTASGRFRTLTGDRGGPGVSLFLHGLTGVAEVWGPTIEALASQSGVCVAFDQRGHGQSPKPGRGYAVGDYVRDAVAIVRSTGHARVRVVGHSMGARVAIVLTAQYPELVESVAVVDIGPEAWRANWQDTVAGIERMPREFPSLDAALGTAGRARGRESLDAPVSAERLRAIAAARFEVDSEGVARWRASREAMKQTVISHRSRNYWPEWRSIRVPALLIRGGDSRELRPHVAQRMSEENLAVRFEEFAGVGHNIPLLAPERLAGTLDAFWRSVARAQA